MEFKKSLLLSELNDWLDLLFLGNEQYEGYEVLDWNDNFTMIKIKRNGKWCKKNNKKVGYGTEYSVLTTLAVVEDSKPSVVERMFGRMLPM